MHDADSELVAGCQRGETAALEALYRRHVTGVWRYGWLRTQSREAAEDIVQETFLRVARSIGGFRGRSTFATWLFAVTRSVTIDYVRRQPNHRQESSALRLVTDREADPVQEEETKQIVRRAVSRLPDAQRDAVLLCELSELSVKEAARTLEWTESKVKVTLFRARRRLRDMLREYVATDSGSVPRKSAGQ